jgi:hypothetical protein
VGVTGYRLVRLLRTLSSEIFGLWQGDQRLGQVDIHYADNSVQADLFLESARGSRGRNLLARAIDLDVRRSDIDLNKLGEVLDRLERLLAAS